MNAFLAVGIMWAQNWILLFAAAVWLHALCYVIWIVYSRKLIDLYLLSKFACTFHTRTSCVHLHQSILLQSTRIYIYIYIYPHVYYAGDCAHVLHEPQPICAYGGYIWMYVSIYLFYIFHDSIRIRHVGFLILVFCGHRNQIDCIRNVDKMAFSNDFHWSLYTFTHNRHIAALLQRMK